MKIPYGVADFYSLRTEGDVYIDRTDRIQVVEDLGKSMLFLRPRRFGKSLWLSTLASYYDLRRADEHERLFGDLARRPWPRLRLGDDTVDRARGLPARMMSGARSRRLAGRGRPSLASRSGGHRRLRRELAIGKTPTPLAHRYFVMRWDFSKIDPDPPPWGVNAHVDSRHERIGNELRGYLDTMIRVFQRDYRPHLPESLELSEDPFHNFEELLSVIRGTPYRLYLLIDEYDNFANEIVTDDAEVYRKLVKTDGPFKYLFKWVKGLMAGSGLERLFITSVSPMVMSDVTSGMNIARNVYLKPALADLCGFTDGEVDALLAAVLEERTDAELSAEDAKRMMGEWYNCYRFALGIPEKIYNPTLVFYFLLNVLEEGAPPRQMLDANLAADEGKLEYLAQVAVGQEAAAPEAGGVIDLIRKDRPALPVAGGRPAGDVPVLHRLGAGRDLLAPRGPPALIGDEDEHAYGDRPPDRRLVKAHRQTGEILDRGLLRVVPGAVRDDALLARKGRTEPLGDPQQGGGQGVLGARPQRFIADYQVGEEGGIRWWRHPPAATSTSQPRCGVGSRSCGFRKAPPTCSTSPPSTSTTASACSRPTSTSRSCRATTTGSRSPPNAGEYKIICNEFCGISHHVMRGKIEVVDGPDLAWLEQGGEG